MVDDYKTPSREDCCVAPTQEEMKEAFERGQLSSVHVSLPSEHWTPENTEKLVELANKRTGLPYNN